MKETKLKFFISTLVFIVALITIKLTAYATNENIEIIKKDDTEYLIYIKENLKNNFEFAFSNNQNDDKDLLDFKKSEKDSIGENANTIAYVNSTTINIFNNPTYMWVKDTENNYILEGIEIDLKLSMDANNLERVANVTKIIPVDATKTNTTSEVVEGRKITTTVGKVILPETTGNYEYIIVQLPNSEDYNNLMKLATRISKFNNETDMYTKISTYKEFNKISTNLRKNANSQEWKNANAREIEQPANAENGTQYVLWIKEDNGKTVVEDIQFLTSYKEVSEEKIIEKITTRLPVTYDNNTLLIVLAILVIATIIVLVRIKTLNKKEEQE